MQHHFDEWHTNIRMIRNEWRQTIKADCHYHYTISNKLWKCWRDYAKVSRAESDKERNATDFYNRNIKSKLFKNWKIVRYELIKQKSNLLAVQEKKNMEFLKFYFIKWADKYETSLRENQVYKFACKQLELLRIEKVSFQSF